MQTEQSRSSLHPIPELLSCIPEMPYLELDMKLLSQLALVSHDRHLWATFCGCSCTTEDTRA